MRRRALESLCEHGDQRWTTTALTALTDPEDTVAVTGIQCLVEWDVRDSADTISALLDSPSELVRTYAAWALGKLGAPRHVARLRRRFERCVDEVEGSALAEALFRLTKRPRYLEYLLAQLRSTDPEARAFTTNSLAGIVTRETFARIVGALAQALVSEESEAVLPSIRRDLREIVALGVDGELS